MLQSQTAEPGSKIHYLQVTWHSNLLVSSTALARSSGHPPIMPISGLSERVSVTPQFMSPTRGFSPLQYINSTVWHVFSIPEVRYRAALYSQMNVEHVPLARGGLETCCRHDRMLPELFTLLLSKPFSSCLQERERAM